MKKSAKAEWRRTPSKAFTNTDPRACARLRGAPFTPASVSTGSRRSGRFEQTFLSMPNSSTRNRAPMSRRTVAEALTSEPSSKFLVRPTPKWSEGCRQTACPRTPGWALHLGCGPCPPCRSDFPSCSGFLRLAQTDSSHGSKKQIPVNLKPRAGHCPPALTCQT